MAVRRKKLSRANGKKAPFSLPVEAPVVPRDDFLPPGFSIEGAEEAATASAGKGKVKTYFLYTEKRGMARYVPMALKHFQKGFRAVLVSKWELLFDQGNARLAGQISGDHFEEGQKWAERNILTELQRKYVLSGGGTARERSRVASRFYNALEKVREAKRKTQEADEELEKAAIEMVLRFGKKSFVWPGSDVTLDACCGPGDKVYWRSRTGKLPELGE